MRLRLADPSLVVLVGAAGSGKSTLAGRIAATLDPDGAVLSSDAFRGLVSGDEADQRATRTAFAILHRELERRLALGRTAIVDATSVTAWSRRALVRRAAAAGVPASAVVLDLPPELVLSRNASRGRRAVPAAAVRRQLDDLRGSLRRGLADEGFAAVHVLRSAAEVDGLEVEWVRPKR